MAAAFVIALASAGACSGPEAPGDGAAERSRTPPAPAPTDAGAAGAAGVEAERPRNVVLVTIDTLRADALGAYGSPRPTSPHIDRLADAGVLFERCTASAPSTLPSHASILTSRHPFAHGARANARFVLPREETTLAERLREAGFATGAEVASVVLHRGTQVGQGFLHYRDPTAPEIEPRRISVGDEVLTLHTRSARDITSRGIEFVREHRDHRFFLWLHYYDPHAPYAPPEPHRSRLAGSPYHGEVSYVDAELGRFLRTLDDLGLARSTLLVVTGDHGEGLGEHGEQTHLFFVYQSTIRVPCIVAGADGLPGARRVEAPVRTIDLAPTVLDVLGLDPLPEAHGRSLLPLMRGEGEFGPRLAYGEAVDLHTTFGVPVLRFVRRGPWKYIHKVEPELYDLARDPQERHNLALERSDEVARLREALRDLLAGAPSGRARVAPVDRDTERQLADLGYVVGGPRPEGRSELASLELSGPDPTSLVPDIERFSEGRNRLAAGDAEAALAIFRDLAERYPESSPVLGGLIEALLALDLREEAEGVVRRALAVAPSYRPYHDTLVRLRLAEGDTAGARRALRAVLVRWPCDPAARTKLASLAAEEGDGTVQVRVLEEGVEDCDPTPDLLNELAYVLATAPDPEHRDGPRAVRVAERAVRAMDRPDPLVLDTLAAAYAEAERWEKARAVASRALELARRRELPPRVRALLRAHRDQIARGEPVRSSRAAGPGDEG